MTVAARPAASVVLVRPTAEDGWETYLLRRSAQSPVLADMWVFPGGTVRPDDLSPAALKLSSDFSPDMAHRTLTRPPGQPPATPAESWAYFAAAARELLEEAGVLLGDFAAQDLAEARRSIEQGTPLAEVVSDHGVAVDLSQLVYYAHWITPEGLPQRFDTRFFLARLPGGQVPSPSAFEMSEGTWLDAETALDRNRAGALPLHFATLSHLRRLAPFGTLDELFEFAALKPVVPVMPRTRELDGRIVPFLAPELQDAW